MTLVAPQARAGAPSSPAATSTGYAPFGLFRLVLALLVVVQHAAATIAPEPVTRHVTPFEIGTLAVYVFFVLSGYIIAEAVRLHYDGRPFAFLANRLLRIVPSYWIALLAVALIGLALAAHGTFVAENRAVTVEELTDPAFLLRNATAVFPFFGGMFREGPVLIPIVWAVRVEILFYGVVFVLIAAARTTGIAFDRIAAAAGAVALVGSVALFGPLTDGALENAPFFVAGMALHHLVQGPRGWSGRLVAAGLLAAAAVVSSTRLLSRDGMIGDTGVARDLPVQAAVILVLVLALALLAHGQADPRGRFARLDRALGAFTYPIYLNHLLVLYLVMSLHGNLPFAGFVLATVTSVVVSCLIALPTEPLVARLRDRVRGRRLEG